MYRNMLLSLILLLFATSVVTAERIDFGTNTKDVGVFVEESNDNRTVVRFEIGGFTKDVVDIDGQTYYSIRCGKEGVLLNASEPELPRVCRSIIIPDNAKMAINVLSSEFVEFTETPVVPSKGNLLRTVNPEDVPYEFGPVYNSNEWYPTELASIREPHIQSDFNNPSQWKALNYLKNNQKPDILCKKDLSR